VSTVEKGDETVKNEELRRKLEKAAEKAAAAGLIIRFRDIVTGKVVDVATERETQDELTKPVDN
jgi:hypothetical protein